MTVEDDLKIVIETVLSTATIERVTIFDLLIANNGTLTSSDVMLLLNTTKPTALRTMTELRAIGLVDIYEWDDTGGAKGKGITLLDEFAWFLSDEFKALREGYKEKHPPHRAIILLEYYSFINKNQFEYGIFINNHKPLPPGCFSLRLDNHVIEQNNINKDVEVFRCKQCDYFSYWESELSKHTVRMHPDPAADKK